MIPFIDGNTYHFTLNHAFKDFAGRWECSSDHLEMKRFDWLKLILHTDWLKYLT